MLEVCSHGFQSTVTTRTIFRDPCIAEKTRAENGICSPPLKKEEPHPGLQHCFGGNRPPPAAAAAVSAPAATAGKTSSDEILVEQIAAGSKPAMQALFARHRTCVYRWLLRFVSNETLAEDLLSEVFLNVWRQAGRFQRRSSVSTWLMSIARHKALSARRRRTEGAELDEKIEATIADPANDPEVALQEKDRGRTGAPSIDAIVARAS
jgi:sigma-70-like protein